MVLETLYSSQVLNFVDSSRPSNEPLLQIVRLVVERHGFVFGQNEYYPERVEDLSDPEAGPLTSHILSAFGRWDPRVQLIRRQVVYVPDIYIPGLSLKSELSQQLAAEITREFKRRKPSNVVVKLPPIVTKTADWSEWMCRQKHVRRVSFPEDGEEPTTRIQMIREEFSHRIKRR